MKHFIRISRMKLSGLWGRRKGGNEVKVGVVARSISAETRLAGGRSLTKDQ